MGARDIPTVFAGTPMRPFGVPAPQLPGNPARYSQVALSTISLSDTRPIRDDSREASGFRSSGQIAGFVQLNPRPPWFYRTKRPLDCSMRGLMRAVVMNMFYTGLGIARTLGARGVPVIGLSAKRGVYGNFTRYAKVRNSPDSRESPDRLLAYLLEMGKEIDGKSVIFPTRDDDLIFLDRFRTELEPFYIPVAPHTEALEACLDKFETFRWAQRAGVSTPRCWKIATAQDFADVLASDVSYPCVLKPLSAHHWRQGQNWQHVGARKAVCVSSAEELRKEYEFIARVEPRALLQELVPGPDNHLFVAACYLDSEHQPVASFTAQKLIQCPETFGTGCIVQTTDRPEIIADALQLLQTMKFSGIAEVEFKWDARTRQHKLIEVNPRPWDQHRLGTVCGSDLIYLAYCHAAGLKAPVTHRTAATCKWVADDVFLLSAIRSFWNRDGKFGRTWEAAQGSRIYGVWHLHDPIPSIVCMLTTLYSLGVAVVRRVGSSLRRRSYGDPLLKEKHAQ